MVDLEKEGAKWASGLKPTEREYDDIYEDVIHVKDNIITFYISIRMFSNALENSGLEEETHLIPYTAKSKEEDPMASYLGETIKNSEIKKE